MSEHPIQGLMQTAMENIKGMVDVNTIVGDPVQTPDGTVILPISKVGFGFAAGGSEFNGEYAGKPAGENGHHGGNGHHGENVHHTDLKSSMPFGGGSGGGVSIRPIAFLVVGKHGVNIVPLDNQTHLFEKLIDSAPMMVEKIQSMFQTGSTSSATIFNDRTHEENVRTHEDNDRTNENNKDLSNPIFY
ncbi:GerW family sporulation protein [Paenibacillus sp.]|uniref:GerW family sporulation protein n=1 Tax=Paenibacillus sp. TaxID=58172 RepID=UPI002839AF02|nr:GerW family sporulation protein [Paenibacillus sp.]MDR0267267.1 GerW family sporulation protein [Paenibacillus sp.]